MHHRNFHPCSNQLCPNSVRLEHIQNSLSFRLGGKYLPSSVLRSVDCSTANVENQNEQEALLEQHFFFFFVDPCIIRYFDVGLEFFYFWEFFPTFYICVLSISISLNVQHRIWFIVKSESIINLLFLHFVSGCF